MPPSASAARASRIPAAHQSAHVLQQQKQYASHLSSQLHTLSRHAGVFGELGHAVQTNQEQAAQVGQEIEQAQMNLSKRSKAAADAAAAAAASSENASSDKENEPTRDPPAPLPPAPDLDALASSLESLARSLASQELQAESQSVGLRTEIARVMEVYEDPAAFLPPPLQGAPDFGGYLSANAAGGSKGRSSKSVRHADQSQQQQHLPPSELLAQAYSSQALHSGLPGADPPQPIYNHTSKSTGFDYGVMTSFLRGMVRARVSEEIDGDDSAHRGLPSMHAGFDPSLYDPADPLTTLRRDLARKFATLERDPVLLASKENVRKSVAEAAAKPSGPGNVLSARLAGGEKKSRRGSLEDAPATAPAGKPRARRTDLNPEVYPAFAELSAIFGPSSGHAHPAGPHAGAQKMFGGLSSAIPSYLAYQEYVASQQAQQEAARAAAEAQRVAEEQREIVAAAKREAREARERRQREEEAAQARAAALAQAQAAAIAATTAAAAALAVPPLPIHQVSSAAAAHPPSHRDHPQQGRMDASTDTRPPLQSAYADAFHAAHPMSAGVFGGAPQSRFDALWEVMPQARDAAVQSEASSLQHGSQHQTHDAGTLMTPRPATARSIAPSLPSSPRQIAPRATAQFGAHYPQQQLDQLQHQEAVARRGTGAQAAGSAPSASSAGAHPRASALTVLEQAALEVQAQGKRVRGEGLSSSRALDSLMATAAQQQQPAEGSVIRVVTRDQTPSELSVPPHPLFSATPSAAIASYPTTGLLNLVLQMYDMPSERQVEAEWKRVLSAEEEAEAKAREERGETQTSQEQKEKSEQDRLHRPIEEENYETSEEDRLRREAEADARVAQAAAARAAPKSDDSAAASAEAKQAEDLRQRLAEESAERARLVAESARLARELEDVKRQQQQQVAQQQQQQMIQQAVQAAVQQSPQPIAAAPTTDPIATAEREAEQRRVWELEARARWTAEQEAKKAQADAAAADAARHAEQLAQIEAATRALQAEAESIRAAAAERKALEAAAIAPALAAEIDKIRAAQMAERAMMDSVREEERKRYEVEEIRRAEERQKQLAAQAAEEALYAQRRAEREAEEERRRELERKREELMENRMNIEAERTAAELAKLRAEVERMRSQPVEAPAAAPVAAAIPLRHRAIRVSHSFGGPDDSQDLSSSDYGFELTDPAVTSRFNPKSDLSEGEIDLAGFHAARRGMGNVSPGQVGPFGAALERPPQRVQMPARRAVERHSAAVLHPPIPSVTPARPGSGAGRKTQQSVAEQKYLAASTSMYSSSSTRDDILDLLNASKLADQQHEGDTDPVQSQSALPLAAQFNVAYTSSIAAARRALQVPSRQVLVGPSSPPLTDISDVGSSRPSTASSVSTPSPVPRHRSTAKSRSPVSSSKKALRLLKKKYAVLQARQLALEDETSSFGSALEESMEPVEEQIARAKRRNKFASAARSKSGTTKHEQQDDDAQFMPSAAVHAHVRRAATRVEAQVEAASRPTPPATADSVTSLASNIHPPPDSAANHPQSALSPLKHRAVRSTTPNLQAQQQQSRVPTPLGQQGRETDAPIEAQPVAAPGTPPHPAAPAVPASGGEDDSYADEFDIPHETEYHAAPPPRTADAASAPSFMTALSPPSSSPPSPAAAAFSPSGATAAASSSSSAMPAARPASSTTARPSSSISTSAGSRPTTTGSGRFVEPASPSSRTGTAGGKASLLTSQPLRMSQAQMVAQHRAKLQAAKMAALQSSAAAATAAAEATGERPSSSASVGSASDPFAAHGGSGSSRPTSSSSLTGGGIGGLYGFDSARAQDRDREREQRRSASPGLVGEEDVEEQLETAPDDHSFNSPESKTVTSTEQWIRSLRDE